MKPEELRIGNWIYDMVELSDRQVWGVKPDRRNHIMINDTEYEMVSPINLTPEWLEKFGFGKFKKDDDQFISPCCDYAILGDFPKDGFYIFNHSEVDGSTDWIRTNRIHHVHQLQNLFYALTGEELTSK